MAPVIVFSVLALLLFGLSTFIKHKEGEDNKLGLYIWGCVIIIIIASVLSVRVYNGTYKDGQIDAMNGDLKYERHVVYPENDTIPVDTLYVKID